MNEVLKKTIPNSILLVDDDEDSLFIAEQLLAKEAGVESIYTYTNPAEAFTLLHEISTKGTQFPECILLDVRMPVMDAFSFLEKAEKLPGFSESGCQVVLISAYFDYHEGPGIRERAKKYAFITHLMEKPFTIDKLLELN